jgi:hypothetical protein
MSMKRTCPISNFTSADCSGGMGLVLSGKPGSNETISRGQSSASAFARLRRDLPSSDFDMASKRALDRGSSTSFRFWARYFLHKGFEARIAAKIVEKWIYFDERNVESGVVVAMLQFIDGVCLIA